MPTLEAMSDASMRSNDDKSNVREGILVALRQGNIIHPLCWSSKLSSRIARSTSTLKLLAAASTTDRVTYMKLLFENIYKDKLQSSELVLHSRTTNHLCLTLWEPQKAQNKIILSSICQEFYQQSMRSIRWTPGSTHLADALTNNNLLIAAVLDAVLPSGVHSHPHKSVVVTRELPGPGLEFSTDL